MESSRPLTSEEEALKRNTDCVYFLASPLTCKKGNECEFRHSEGARVNPRDCWYWLNGNCLNPKCQFRHPPLDGLFGPGTPSGPPASSLRPAAPTHIPAAAYAPNSYNSSKQSVPCYYFQKGQCLKGDKCLFMHVAYPGNNLAAQQSTNGLRPSAALDSQQLTNGLHPSSKQQEAKISASFTETSQKVSWGIRECNTAPQQNPKVVDRRGDMLHSPAKSASKAESDPVEGHPKPPRSRVVIAPVSSDSTTPSRPYHHRQLKSAEDEHYLNGRETDEFLGESSPGFDVLVDDDMRESDYYREEEEYHPEYVNVAGYERDRYDGNIDYDHHREASPERAIEISHKRRAIHRLSSPDEVDGSDLRHRLLKQRRLQGRRLDEPRRSDRYREERRVPRALSSRLQGRISLPARSPPASEISYRRRPQDRIQRYQNEEFGGDQRGFRFRSSRRDDGDSIHFSGPKSLAELKGSKVTGSSLDQPKKRMDRASEDPLSFEGPKPLSDILRRKRESSSENPKIQAVGGDDGGLVQKKDGELTYSNEYPAEDRAMTVEAGDEHTEDDFGYEAAGGEDLKLDEDENAYQDDEDDKFAKKLGSFFS